MLAFLAFPVKFAVVLLWVTTKCINVFTATLAIVAWVVVALLKVYIWLQRLTQIERKIYSWKASTFLLTSSSPSLFLLARFFERHITKVYYIFTNTHEPQFFLASHALINYIYYNLKLNRISLTLN